MRIIGLLSRPFRICAVFMILAVMSVGSASARVEIVEVNVEGLGMTLRDAIMDGVRSAVSMVNGVEVAAQTSLLTSSVSVETDQGEAYAASSAFAEQISSSTKGVVESYDVINYEQDAGLGNNYVVQLSVKVAKYKQSKQLDRLRMAVTGLYIDNTVSDRSKADKTAYDLQMRVIDYLTQTRRFAMLDRNNLADTDAELNLIASSGMATKELARLGNKVGTDYLVVMTLNALDTRVTEKKMRTNNKIRKTTVVFAEVAVRILDVATSQIKFADTIMIETQDSHRKLAREGGRLIGQVIQNAIYPARIIDLDGDTVTIGQGGKTINKGEIYELVQLGKRLIDPYTKESLGFKEIPVGKVEITRVQSKQSTAVILELSIDDPTQLTNYKFIIRPVRPDISADLETARENVNKAKNRIDELKKSFDKE